MTPPAMRKRASIALRLLRILSTTCFVAGLALLAWPLARILMTASATGEAQAEALAAWDHQTDQSRRAPNGVMVLEIPRLGIRRAVPDGATVQNLKHYGVGHISWTAFPPVEHAAVLPGPGRFTGPISWAAVTGPTAAGRDRGGVVAIAGHRTTYGAPFFRIGTLHTGDAVMLVYAGRRYVYRVDRQLTTRPSDVEALDGDADEIALVTCTPPFSAAFRLIVFGHLERTTADPGALATGR